MRNFWKLVVFVSLFAQFSFAHSVDQNTTASFQKKIKNTFSKQSLGDFQFIRPSIDRGTIDLKQNNRIPVSIGYCPRELQSLSILRDNTLKIVLVDQDIDRCISVSILLFPFHYFW